MDGFDFEINMHLFEFAVGGDATLRLEFMEGNFMKRVKG